MDKPKLLIIDDDESITYAMKWAFKSDYDVLLASSREEAVEIFRSERPPLVTLDLGLPPEPHGVEQGFLTLADPCSEKIPTSK